MIFIKLGKRCREHCFMRCFYMLVTLFLISGCATVKESNWSADQKVNIGYDTGWAIITSTISKEFTLQTIDEKTGYLKTEWKVTDTCWGGLVNGGNVPCKQVRIIVNVESKEPFRFKIKAEKLEGVGITNYTRWNPNGNDEVLERRMLDVLMRKMRN